MAVRRLHLASRYWRLVHRRRVLVDGVERDGACDPPLARNRAIYLRDNLKPLRRLEILIHEMLHAISWDVSDDCVTVLAEHCAELMWIHGVRVHGEIPALGVMKKIIWHCLRIANHHLEEDEEAVTIASDMARALHRLGYGLQSQL